MANIRISQRNILKFFCSCIFIIAGLIILRVFLIFIPPLLITVKFSGELEQSILDISGIGFGSQDHSSEIYLNGKAIYKENILSWSPFKIQIFVTEGLPQVNVMRIQVRERKSNNKLFSNKIVKNAVNYDDDKKPLPKQTQTVTLRNPTRTSAYLPLVFTANPHIRYFYQIKSEQETLPLPNYLVRYTASGFEVYLPEVLWFERPDSIELLVSSNQHNLSFSIPWINVASQSQKHTSVDVTLEYPNTHNPVFMIPISSQYQKVTILNDEIVWDNISSHIYHEQSLSTLSTTIDYVTFHAHDVITPMFYQQEIPLRYLFANTEEDKKILANLIEKLQINSTFQNLSLPETYYSPSVISLFSLNSNGRATSDLYSTLNEYFSTLDASIRTLSLQDISELATRNFVDEIDNVSRIEILHSSLIAQQLRNQQLIARTVIGYEIPNNDERSLNIANAWVEILSRELEWIILKDGVLSTERGNRLSIVVWEKYLTLRNNGIRPLIPKIKTVSKR